MLTVMDRLVLSVEDKAVMKDGMMKISGPCKT